MSSGIRCILGLLLLANCASAYTWPNPQLDELESLVYDQRGYNERGILTGAVTPCDKFSFGSVVNRSNVADWVRTAYHDMSTHNIKDGTDGLDASIQFEMNRAENAGDSFFNTLKHLTMGMSRYVGAADFIALGAKTAIEQCDGPHVPFRGGRVDATSAGVPGVPTPQQDLATHIAAFKRQGFTKTEMIGLVACGHSFGGVQHKALPNIVPLPDGFDDVSAPFDSTPFTFDNNIASEFVHGTTNNPLVICHNDTLNSDKRVFGSDGNITVNSFTKSPTLFKSECGTLFARMLDTVPKGVRLTEVIEPSPVKPQSVALQYMGDGTLHLSGEVRFWGLTESASRTIKLVWADRNGKTKSSYVDSLGHNAMMASTALYKGGNVNSLWYNFGALAKNFSILDEKVGISKFWFEVDEGHGAVPRIEDQRRSGFVLQDKVMLANSSCVGDNSGSSIARIDIAVHRDVKPSRVYLEYDIFNGNVGNGATTVTVKTADAHLAHVQKRASSDYTMWTVELPSSALSSSLTQKVNIAADIRGQKIITSSFAPFAIASSNACS